MRRIKLTIGYAGGAYRGWQRQPGMVTVQSVLEDAIFSLTGQRSGAVASGRTDAGVHALGQVVHFDTDSAIPAANFVGGLNRFLPPDIRVKESAEVSADFHARFSAHEKTYRYLVYESERDEAVLYGRAERVGRLDLPRMRRAAETLVGTHDFASFCASGADTATSVRTVKRLGISRHRGRLVSFTITADGFLYNMVRLIVAVLVRVGEGKMPPDEVGALLAAADKNAVRWCMPPDGLYLVEVKY